MTIMTCNTPKFGGKRKANVSKQIESRVIGVEVYCGPVKEVFFYYTDNLVSGGANIMVEVQRQALIDLEILLKEKNCILQDKMIFQFDNCGENKV